MTGQLPATTRCADEACASLIDADSIQAVVSRAMRPGLPPYDQLEALEQALLDAIDELYEYVDDAERLRPSVSRRGRLTSIRYQAAVGLGPGLVSAQMQVRALARDCAWLLVQYKAGSR